MKKFLSENKWPLLLGATAIIVRLIYLIQISRQPGFSLLMVDEQWHWLWAKEIIETSFWGEGSYFRGPLYPYFLALIHFITGGSIFWAKAMQLLLSGVTSIFIFKTAQHLFGLKAAVLAGLIYALYGTLVFYESMFLIAVLFLPLLTWGMYRLIAYQDGISLKTWIVTGLIFGLAALARPNVLLVVPFLAIWVFFKHRKNSEAYVKAAKPALAILAGLAIAIAPVTVRNMAVTGEFILISSQGGINFYLGNNKYADGLMMIMPEVELDNSITWNMFVPLTNSLAERETGREMSDAEISGFWTDKAVNFITNHPVKFLNLVWKKKVYLFSGFENSDAVDIY
ncbi:MAG: ArnT family glycosyltransferase, partial [Candidatus Zixiibacteriota bacterium]